MTGVGQITRAMLGLTVALGLASCAPLSAPTGGLEVPVTPRDDTVTSVTPPRSMSAVPRAGTAVLAMLKKADGQLQTGQLDGAVATLERALRLEPRNAWIWHRLAALRLQQGNMQQAINMAAKSNALIGEDNPLRAHNDSIIARARGR